MTTSHRLLDQGSTANHGHIVEYRKEYNSQSLIGDAGGLFTDISRGVLQTLELVLSNDCRGA
jgi:hypothetical protein